MDNSVAISLDNVSKKYGKTRVFQSFSLELPAGGVIGILGENGIGKTTMLKMIADVTKPDEGRVLVGGSEVSRLTRDMVSYLVEPSKIERYMKVSDSINWCRDFYQDFDDTRAREICEAFNIDVGAKIPKLSKGGQERVCLMLCLSRKAPVYLLDEPMAGFDPKFKRDLVKTILTFIEPWQTLIISTHLLRDLDTLFDEVVILTGKGAIVANAENIRGKGQSLEDYYLEVSENENVN